MIIEDYYCDKFWGLPPLGGHMTTTIVKGGTNAGFSNRMRESADMLEEVETDEYNFLECETLEDIRDKLSEMVNEDHHLVGSRGYVYNSNGMRGLINSMIEYRDENDGKPGGIYDWALFTRTNGLRDAVFGTFKEYFDNEV